MSLKKYSKKNKKFIFAGLAAAVYLSTAAVISQDIVSAKDAEIVFGDLSGDGKVDLTDAVAALKLAVGIDTVTDEHLAIADTNSDSKIDLNDAVAILKAAVGIEELKGTVVAPEPTATNTITIPHSYANASEGIELRMTNTEYFENLTQNDLDYRVKKKGATLEEFKALAQEQGEDFTDKEKQGIEEALNRIEKRFSEIGFNYPSSADIVFIKSKMRDECGATGYTQKNQIYLKGDDLYFMSGESRLLDEIIIHELFHILSRNYPEFRQQIYKIFGFTITNEPEFSSEISNILGSNPDVEAYDSYAMFNINGVMTKGIVVTLLRNPYSEGANLFANFSTGIVPYDNPDTYYTMEEVSNFWDVLGENSHYVLNTEEVIADNFTLAVLYGMDGRDYKDPELIQSILDVLANY